MSSSTTPLEQALKHDSARLPGDQGMWMFIVADLVVFSIFFIYLLYYRGLDTQAYTQAAASLDQVIGLTNTILLLTSSMFLALGVNSVRNQKIKAAVVYIVLTLLCGAYFLVNKGLEWADLFKHGYTLEDDFYLLFFPFTGIHGLHVIVGMALLAYAGFRLHKEGQANPKTVLMLENFAIFWHLVDLLWIILFALLYTL